MFFDVFGDVAAFGQVEEFTAAGGFVPFDPGVFGVVETCEAVGDYFEGFGFFAHTDYVAGFHFVRRDVNDATVDHNVAVEHDLASSGTGGSDAEAVNYVVEACFKELEQDDTGYTFET